MEIRHCYEILGLSPGASQEQVKEAYRQLARQWHPDKVAHNPKLQAIALEEMKVINASYDALKSYQPSTHSAPSDKKSQPEQNVWNRAEEAKQRAAAEQQQREGEQKERDAARRKREVDRLRVQQEAEAAYQSEQLANAKKEAERKQKEAKREMESQGQDRQCVECGNSLIGNDIRSLLWNGLFATYSADGFKFCSKCCTFRKN